MSNLAVIKQNISTALVANGVEAILPKGVTIEAFAHCATTAVINNKGLDEADHDSLIMALTKCASDGLVPDNKEATLTVFSTKTKVNGNEVWIKKAQYMPMIDGVLKRARMSGQVSSITSKAVYENDSFEYWMDEDGEHYKYIPSFSNRGEIKLCFACARMNNGELLMEVMTKEDIDKVKKASKTSGFGPWVDWYDRMGCKAVTHRLTRRLPNASEIVAMCETGMNMNFSKNIEEKEVNPQLTIESPVEELKKLTEGIEESKVLKWLRLESIDDLTPEIAEKAVIAKRNAKQ